MSRRRAPVHAPVVDHRGRGAIVLITVCSRGRRRILADAACVAILIDAWRCADDWRVGRFIVLPDHLHLFCAPTMTARPLPRWVAHWKSSAARAWPHPADRPLWQRDFWDRQLRSDEHYAERWDYVRHNAVRHRLVAAPVDWPYQGELHRLDL